MKTLIAIIIALTLPHALHAEAAPLTFAVVTTETKWADGLTSEVGEVEIVVATQGDNYIVWCDNGKNTLSPKPTRRLSQPRTPHCA